MRVLISPDKFKHSLSASQVCLAVEAGIKSVIPEAIIEKLPLADGGEGSLEILEANLNADRIEIEVSDPLFRPIKAWYLLDGEKAYVEMAKASGLPLLKAHERSVMNASTYGTGELIADAIDHGAKEIFVMIGGSATNDGGCGMAEALGAKFYDKQGKLLKAIRAKDLINIGSIDTSKVANIKELSFTILSDVQNPLTGTNGASLVFAKQKGATKKEALSLDEGLQNLASVLNNGFEDSPGSGAAGGLGYGLISFLGAELRSGIESVMKLLNYDQALLGVDIVITGEGKLDSQTLEGKVISGVKSRCKNKKIPIGIICGVVEDLEKIKDELNLELIFQVSDKASSSKDSIKNAGVYVEQLARELINNFVSKSD